MVMLPSRRSFEALSSWLSDARTLASPDLEVVVVGNKLDQEEDRQVPYLEASRWAQEHSESRRLDRLMAESASFFALWRKTDLRATLYRCPLRRSLQQDWRKCGTGTWLP